jgi:hypothetical protein
MSRRMLSEETWRDIGEVIVAVDGNPLAAIRVLQKSLPRFALAFVRGGVS